MFPNSPEKPANKVTVKEGSKNARTGNNFSCVIQKHSPENRPRNTHRHKMTEISPKFNSLTAGGHGAHRCKLRMPVCCSIPGEKHKAGTVMDVWLLPTDWRSEGTLNKSAILRVAHISNQQSKLLFFDRVAKTAIKIQ